ncbi:MAG: alpha/beta hydrolase [Candidatus Micrarchaeota archaeon]
MLRVAHATQSRTVRDSSIFPKKMFRTSFGVDVEYLMIPKHSSGIDPNSPTIIFFNGFMLRFSQWGFQMPRYTVKHSLEGFSNYNLLFFNNLGHGHSEINGTTTHEYLKHCAQAVYELIHSLGANSRIFTVAHSMGSPISLEFQRLTEDQVEAMAFVSPVFSNPLRVFPHADFVEPRLERIQTILERAHVASTLTKTLGVVASDLPLMVCHALFTMRTGSKIRREAFTKNLQKSLELDVSVFVTALLSLIQTGDEIGSRLSRVILPKKVILGDKDFITDKSRTEQIVRELAPDTSIVVMENTSHWANSERPRSVNRELAAFFDSVNL